MYTYGEAIDRHLSSSSRACICLQRLGQGVEHVLAQEVRHVMQERQGEVAHVLHVRGDALLEVEAVQELLHLICIYHILVW